MEKNAVIPIYEEQINLQINLNTLITILKKWSVVRLPL